MRIQKIEVVQHPDLPWNFLMFSDAGEGAFYSAPTPAGTTAQSCRDWFQAKADAEDLAVTWVEFGSPRAREIEDAVFLD